MPGNPNKEGRDNPQYQMGRRRYTKVPGYHSVLPRVFPFRYRTTQEQAVHLVCDLLDGEYTGFALTAHPSSFDGHMHLWLSVECAEYLTDTLHVISTDRLEKVE